MNAKIFKNEDRKSKAIAHLPSTLPASSAPAPGPSSLPNQSISTNLSAAPLSPTSHFRSGYPLDKSPSLKLVTSSKFFMSGGDAGGLEVDFLNYFFFVICYLFLS